MMEDANFSLEHYHAQDPGGFLDLLVERIQNEFSEFLNESNGANIYHDQHHFPPNFNMDCLLHSFKGSMPTLWTALSASGGLQSSESLNKKTDLKQGIIMSMLLHNVRPSKFNLVQNLLWLRFSSMEQSQLLEELHLLGIISPPSMDAIHPEMQSFLDNEFISLRSEEHLIHSEVVSPASVMEVTSEAGNQELTSPIQCVILQDAQRNTHGLEESDVNPSSQESHSPVPIPHETSDEVAEATLSPEHASDTQTDTMEKTEEVRCQLCQFSHKSLMSLLNHLKRCHSTHVQYEECRQELHRESRRRRKAYEKAPRKCPFCLEEFPSLSSQYHHTRFRCRQNPDSIKGFNCDICGTKSSSMDLFLRHRRKHEGARYQCAQCGVDYEKRSAFVSHVRRKHSSGLKGKIYVCDKCNKKFDDRSKFETHAAIHSDARDCQCELCGKSFKTPQNLKAHVKRKHLNQFPYRCKMCGKGMDRKSKFESHRCDPVKATNDPVLIHSTEEVVNPEGSHCATVLYGGYELISSTGSEGCAEKMQTHMPS